MTWFMLVIYARHPRQTLHTHRPAGRDAGRVSAALVCATPTGSPDKVRPSHQPRPPSASTSARASLHASATGRVLALQGCGGSSRATRGGHLALGERLDDEAHVVGEEEERPALARRPCVPPPSLSSYQPASAACPTPPRPQQDLPFGIPGPPNRCVPGPAALRLPAKAAANARRRLARRTRLNEQLKTIRQHAGVVISVAIRQSETSSADPPSLRESYEIRTGLTASDLSFALCARDRSPPLQPTHNSQIVAAISTCVAQGNHVVRCHRHNAGQL